MRSKTYRSCALSVAAVQVHAILAGLQNVRSDRQRFGIVVVTVAVVFGRRRRTAPVTVPVAVPVAVV